MATWTSIFGVIFVSIILYCARVHEVAAEFYQGCSNSTSSCSEYNVASSQLPFSCIRQCINKRLSFAAIHSGHTCTCCSSVDSWTNKSNCTISCPSEKSLFCGGNGFKSVYTTALPVIYKVSMALKSKAIPVNTGLALAIIVFVNGMTNETRDLQSIQGMNQTLSKLYVTWELNDSPWNYSIHSLDGNETRTNKTIGFSIPGEYKLCVKVKNLVSEASECRDLDVLVPVSGIRLVDVKPKTKALVDGQNATLIKFREDLFLKVSLDEGSKVDFIASFADGSLPVFISTKKMKNPYAKGLKCITIWHKYLQCGNYTVQVDVSNAIGNVSLPVIPVNVQKPVSSIKFSLIGGLPGEWVKIKVRNNDDYLCSFRFNWTFDDWKTVNTTTVPYIKHKFYEVKKHMFSLKVFNDINDQTVNGSVYIQTPLKNVTLSIEGNTSSPIHIFELGNSWVKLDATTFPSFHQVHFTWYSNRKEMTSGFSASLKKKFREIGRFQIQVFARNFFVNSSLTVSSNTLIIVIEERINKVTLEHSMVTVSKQNFSFTVKLNGGSNVNILWDFGDGSTMTSTDLQVTHYYKKEGLYNVKVLAYNNVSRADDSSSIFVTKIPSCQPPNVKIIGWRSFQIYRFEEVNIESQVKIDCSWEDFSLLYEWKIIPESKKAFKANISSLKVSESVLIIPPNTLNYGKYDVILKVYKNNTVLSDEKKIEIIVVQHGLIASIQGGSMRVIGYGSKDPIILDGSESRDPDFPNESEKLRFKWECHLLNNTNATPCFDQQSTKIDFNQAVFELPLKHLPEGLDALSVTLTVSKEGMDNKSTWQILRMVNDKPHLLSVRCPQCENAKVNYNDALIVQGKCTTCTWKDQNLHLKWQLYLVSKDKHFEPDECVELAQMPHQRDAFHREAPPLTTVRSAYKFDVPQSMQQPVTSPTWRGRSTGRPRPDVIKTTKNPYTSFATTGPYPEPAIIEAGETCNSSLTVPSNCKQTSKNSYWLCVTSRPTVSSRRGRYTGGSVNTGSGTLPNSPQTSRGSIDVTQRTLTTTQIPLRTKPATTPSHTKEKTQALYEPTYVVPEAADRHRLLSIERKQYDMTHFKTKTGLNNLNFVLNKENLVSGKTYMIALKVKSGLNSDRQGMANIFFKVNDIPTIGRFGVEPPSGQEIETEFKLKCQDESDKRLNYRVTYKIDVKEDREFLLYSGTNLEPSFILPSGLKEQNFSVTLFISAYDDKGSTVQVCPKTIKVKPTMIHNVSSEEYLLNKTKSTYMQTLIKVGKEQQVKQFVKVLSEALNRLSPVKNTSSKFHLRKEARLEMVNVIIKFRIRDMTSAIQTAEALEGLTRVKTELNIEELELISHLMLEAESQIVKQASQKSNALTTNLLNLLTKALSNVLAGSLQFQRSHPVKHKKIQLQSMKGIHEVTKYNLKTLVLGEKSSKVVQPSFSAVISQSKLMQQTNWTLRDVTFLLPSQMDKELGLENRSFSTACVGTTMVVYEENPYTWNTSANQLYETKASSLVLSNCNAEPINVRHLQNEIEVTLPWLVKEVKSANELYTVNWQYLNIHSVHFNPSMENHTLQLDIQILSKLDQGLVLRIFVSFNSKEDIQTSTILKTSSGGSVRFKFTAKDLINASSVIRIGILMKDTDLNRIKKIFSAAPVNYSISSKWIGCYYWNEEKQTLSTQGCLPTDNTTDTFIKCRCNHLTTFVGKAFWSPNPLSVKDLRDIQSISWNPVCLALVLSLFGVYIVLLVYCYKLDKNKSKDKEGEIVLANVLCSRIIYRYKITVETGHWFGSGTSSSVVMRMFGDSNTSDPIELKSNDKPLFRRGSKDVFIFDSPCDLSPLKKIHVWHYNDGDNPSWYLDMITVQDMTTGEKWYFDNYRWLAIDEDDGKVDVEIFPVDGKTHVSKLQLYYHEGRRYLLDYHLWLSVFARPSSSFFNHKQRLTCCFSLILSFLCVNAAWFHVTSSGTKLYEILGFLDVRWETVLSGILCSIVVLPGNLLWIIMFRYAKPFDSFTKVHPAPYDDPITETSCIVNNTEHYDDTVSILDQTIETLLYLKALGRKIKPPHWYDRSSIDSVFPNLEDYSYYSVFDVQTACPTKAPPSPLLRDDMSSSNSEQPSQGPKNTFWLPHCFVSIAWFGCGLTILASGFITVWYGLSFGRQKSILWLQSLCFSVVESVLISQPFMILAVLLYTMCSNLIRKSPSKVEPISEDDKSRKNISSSRTSDDYMNLKTALDARRHQRYLKFLKPLNKALLFDACEKKHVRKVVYDYVRDVIACLVGIFLVCVIVNSMYCRSAFNIKKSVQNTILKHSANEMGSVPPDLWWRNNHEEIVNLLYWRPYEWSLRKNRTSQIFFKDTLSVLVGKPRIRKYTTRKHEKCSDVDVDGTKTKRICRSRCLRDSGQWSSVELSRTKSIAKEKLKDLITREWISMCTEHISIDFVLYAAALDVYSAVSWEVNGPNSGRPFIKVQVKSIKDAFKSTALDIFLKVCKGVFVATFVFCLYSELVYLTKYKSKYFKSVWKFIEVLFLLLSAISIVAYVHWSVSVYSLIREILSESGHDVYAAVSLVHHRQELLIIVYSLILFLLVLKIIHLMKVFTFVQRFCYLLWTTCGFLAALMVFVLISVIMLSHFGYLLFGRIYLDFATFSRSLVYTFGLLRLRGKTEQRESVCLPIMYYFTSVFLLVVVLRGLSMAIFNWFVHSIKRRQYPTHLLIDYLKNLNRVGVREKTIDDDDESDDEDGEIIPVEYACDEVEIQMGELLFKMENLVGESKLADLCLSSSSDLLLSSDAEFDYDYDVEYLYRQGEFDIDPGSGYDSDQSLYSHGSGSAVDSQEGLTDLELQRRISNSSCLTTSMDGNPPSPLYVKHIESKVMNNSGMNITHVRGTEDVQHERILQETKSTPKQLYRSQSNSLTSHSGELHDPSLIVKNQSRKSSLDNNRSKTKQTYHPLTRKPKFRQGQICLDDVPKDIGLTSSAGLGDCKFSGENRSRAQGNRTATPKKPNYLRTLGLLPKTSVAPIDDRYEKPLLKDDAFNSSGDSRQFTSDSSTCAQNQPSSGSSNNFYGFDAPSSPSEPGFSNNGFYEDNQDVESVISDDEEVPLPGLIGDICTNNDIGTNIGPDAPKKSEFSPFLSSTY